ncbi:HIT domain-containing protein [Micrococcales bacterium 31B]|nr:HIT domain-containing protein [Micrococcales bacterium 31B]
MTSTDCIFCSIVAGGIPADVVWQSDTLLAFRDINPLAQTHVLIIPRSHHRDVVELAAAEPQRVAEIAAAAREVATLDGRDDFKLLFNTGPGAGQTVFHAHAHVIAGERLRGSSSTESVPA